MCPAQVVRVRVRSADQQITHSMTNEAQTFAPVRWDIRNATLNNGCLVEWTADNFRHQSRPEFQADCEMSLRLVSGSRRARWNVVTPIDASSISTGKNSASVSLTSERNGNAQVEISLRFHHANAVSLASGNYETTITGTITGL